MEATLNKNFAHAVANGFTNLPNKIFMMYADGLLSPSELITLIYVQMLNNFREHRTSRKQLESVLRMNRETISKMLKSLCEKGFIEIEQVGKFIIIHSNIVVKTETVIELKTKEQRKQELENDTSIETDENEPAPMLDTLHAPMLDTLPAPQTDTIEIRCRNNIRSNMYIKEGQCVEERDNNSSKESFDTHSYNFNQINQDFPYPKDILAIKRKWVEVGLRYEPTEWEFSNLRQIAEEVCKHPCNTIDVLNCIQAYSENFKDPDSIYKFNHSISSFFGSKGSWKIFLRGNYTKGQFSKSNKVEQKTPEQLKAELDEREALFLKRRENDYV